MLKTITFISLFLVSTIILGQTFTKHDVWEEKTTTGPGSRGSLIDFDGDGDKDFLVLPAKNSSYLTCFINDSTDLDSAVTLLNNNELHVSQNIKLFTVFDIDNDLDDDIIALVDGILFSSKNLGSGNFDTLRVIDSLRYSPSISCIDHGDIDGDGLEDLIMATATSNAILASKNLGGFNFQSSKILCGMPNTILTFKMSDLDNDGDLDFITTYEFYIYNTNNAVKSINNGSGVFTPTPITSIEGVSSSFTLEDYNGDGYIDFGFITHTTVGSNAVIYWNTDTNSFNTSTIIKSPNSSTVVSLSGFYSVDYDSDGDKDIIIGETIGISAGKGVILNNDGLGNFNELNKSIEGGIFFAHVNGGSNLIINEIFSTDINKDGRMDIISKTNSDHDIITHIQNSDTTFSKKYINNYLHSISRFQYLDVDYDGYKDIVSIEGDHQGKMRVNYNNGTGKFNRQEILHDNTAFVSEDVLLTDWDGNGKLDKIYASSNFVWLHANFQDTALDTLIVLFQNLVNPYTTNGYIGVQNGKSEALHHADIDNDGDIDLVIVVAESNGNKVVWIENTGNFYFNVLSVVNTAIYAYALGDLDGDNDLDFAGFTFSGLSTYHFDAATKSFVHSQTKPTSVLYYHQFVIADPDNDGDMDIVYSGLNWLENTDGLGTLANEAVLLSGVTSYSNIIATDINQDGLIDFISHAYINIPFNNQSVIRIIENQGSNTFSITSTAYGIYFGIAPTFIIGDVDYDGVQDIISGDLTSRSHVPVWFRTCYPTYSSLANTTCDSLISPSGKYTWKTTNTYTDTIPNSIGCDSIITINLTINRSTTYNDVQTHCDTYTWIDGNTYTSSNNSATHTLTNSKGCDSVITLDLTINTTSASTDVQTHCDTYTWIDGNTYTSSNNSATHTLTNSKGCDSVITLDLTINTASASTDIQSHCDTYTWIDGNTYTSSNNSATHTLTNSKGCDSIITLDLTINTASASTDIQSHCDTYTWIDGNTYTSSNNSATHTLTNSKGCDSIITLDLTINTASASTDVQSHCDTYTWIDGNTYTSSNNSATHTLTNSKGCDSVITLDLTINTASASTDIQSHCDTYTWIDGNTYTSSNNSATHTLTNSKGCDSVITLDLTINTASASTDIQSHCDTYTWIDGNTYTSSNNSATHTLTNSKGCDSIITLDLTINTATFSNLNISSMNVYTSPSGNTYSFSGNYIDTITNSKGCDSIISISLTISVTSLDENQINLIKIYPNPTSETISIFITNDNIIGSTITIYDQSGKIVMKNILKNKKTKFDLSNLASGIYYIKVGDNFSKKIIKQ